RNELPNNGRAAVADAIGGRHDRRASDAVWQQVERTVTARAGQGRFPPAPGDYAAWSRVPDGLKPAVRRVADGPSSRVDELRALGNAVVPAVACRAFRELYGRLMESA